MIADSNISMNVAISLGCEMVHLVPEEGGHIITARATDNSTNFRDVSRTITVAFGDTTLPDVNITLPTDGTSRLAKVSKR